MKKYLSILAVIGMALMASHWIPESAPPLHPIFDLEEGQALRHFRTTQQRHSRFSPTNFKGLDRLRASGSGQFSEPQFAELIRRLELTPEQLVVFDLRQESHGFVDGIPVSWTDGRNNYANRHKTKSEVERDERERLHLISREKKIVLGPLERPLSLAVHETQTESTLTTNLGAAYIRLPVTDHNRPSDEVVDEFIAAIRALSPDQWVHFHCRAGKGRTTTFLILLDIMKNGQQVSLQDIVARQHAIGGANLHALEHKIGERRRAAEERRAFVEEFYRYCSEVPDFTMKWSEWQRQALTSKIKKFSCRIDSEADKLGLCIGKFKMNHPIERVPSAPFSLFG